MGKYIIALVSIDLLGKLVYFSERFGICLLLFMMILGLVWGRRYLKRKFDPFNFSMLNFMFTLLMLVFCFLFGYSLFMLIISLFKIKADPFMNTFYLFMLSFYLALCITMIYLLSHFNNAISFFRKMIPNTVILASILIVAILLLTESISTLVFYDQSYQQYQNQIVVEKISKVKEEITQESLRSVFTYLEEQHELRAITNIDYKERFKDIKQLYKEQKYSLPPQLSLMPEEISGEYELPAYPIFIKMFRFSFYQHYILGLEDELTEFQKYIAKDPYLSWLQMVHVLFTKLVDLIIIGKIINLLSENGRRRRRALIRRSPVIQCEDIPNRGEG